MKECSKCNEEKAEDQFYKRSQSSDGLQAQCKVCAHGYYASPGTMQKYKDRAKKRAHSNAKLLVELKQKLMCLICGEDESCCLDFHHLDPSMKSGSVSEMIGRQSWLKIIKEIEKCICICSNCHRKIHANVIPCPSS